MTHYASFQNEDDPDGNGEVLVHVADSTRSRWTHIVDLDEFFKNVYRYYLESGYLCVFLKEFTSRLQYLFMIFLTAYLIYGIQFRVLLNGIPITVNATKLHMSDVFLPYGCIFEYFSAKSWTIIIISWCVWSLCFLLGVRNAIKMWDIKQFYNSALKIGDDDLCNLSWNDVASKMMVAQREQQMCIHKSELTELDITHRIMRHDDYFIAMVNKGLLPPRQYVPFVGECVIWPSSLTVAVEMVLFWTPWSPFARPFGLRELYKKANLRMEAAARLRSLLRWATLLAAVLSPIIFASQFLYSFCNLTVNFRRDASVFAKRRWSAYGKLYMRHFNELDHQIEARLSRARRPLSKYLSAFSSPLVTILAETTLYYVTTTLGILMLMAFYDEDLFGIEHMFSLLTILGLMFASLASMSSEDANSLDLDDLLTKVLDHTHYLPTNWTPGDPHTARIRSELEQFFPYTITLVLENIFAPFLTPLGLWKLSNQSTELVDFLRCFTVNVGGVGEICSFAQMDLKKNGNPDWHHQNIATPEQYSQTEGGKLELSLINFKTLYPNWATPDPVKKFVDMVRNRDGDGTASMRPNFDGAGGSTTPRSFILGPEPIPAIISSRLGVNRGPVEGDLIRMAPPMTYSNVMLRNEDSYPLSAVEMSANVAYLHSLNRSTIEQNVKSVAVETTPLISH